MKPLRIVIDTNVLISGLCFGGPPAKVIQLALNGKIEVFTSSPLIAEFLGVMKLKFPSREATILNTLNELTLLWEVVSTQGWPALCVIAADPADNRVLECALAASADCIVSGDKHLLDLKRYRNVAILPPSRFLERFT